MLYRYVDECLKSKFDESAFALQDVIKSDHIQPSQTGLEREVRLEREDHIWNMPRATRRPNPGALPDSKVDGETP